MKKKGIIVKLSVITSLHLLKLMLNKSMRTSHIKQGSNKQLPKKQQESAPMQAVTARTLEGFNHQKAKMFLLTDKLCASKLKLIRIFYGGFLIHSIVYMLKFFKIEFLIFINYLVILTLAIILPL